MSILKVNSIEPANAGSEDYYLCRAWVTINQTGTQNIRASGNVSSITDSGVGYSGVTFANAMSDADYSCAYGKGGSTSSERQHATGKTNTGYTTAACNVFVVEGGVSNSDASNVSVQVIR